MNIRGFIVRVYNEDRWIGHCLQSIIDKFGQDISIIIIDNQSTDDTMSCISLFKRQYPKTRFEIVELARELYTPGKAINLGIERLRDISSVLSSNDVVGLMSAHCVYTDVNKQQMRGYFNNPLCAGVFGRQTPIYRGYRITDAKGHPVWQRFQKLQHEFAQLPHYGDGLINPTITVDDQQQYFFHNACAFIRLSSWTIISIPEVELTKEDRVWARLIVDRGYRYIYDDGLQCDHHWTPGGATWVGFKE